MLPAILGYSAMPALKRNTETLLGIGSVKCYCDNLVTHVSMIFFASSAKIFGISTTNSSPPKRAGIKEGDWKELRIEENREAQNPRLMP